MIIRYKIRTHAHRWGLTCCFNNIQLREYRWTTLQNGDGDRLSRVLRDSRTKTTPLQGINVTFWWKLANCCNMLMVVVIYVMIIYGVEVVTRKVKKIIICARRVFSHAKDDYNVYFWRELSIFVFLGLVFNQCIFAI